MADLTTGLRENDPDTSPVRNTFHVDDAITDVNIDAIRSAISGVTLGKMNQSTLTMKKGTADVGNAGKNAQAGAKFHLKMQDASNSKLFSSDIGTADASLLTDGSDDLDLTAGPGLALKTAIETHVLSPDGNSVLVLSAHYKNRNRNS